MKTPLQHISEMYLKNPLFRGAALAELVPSESSFHSLIKSIREECCSIFCENCKKSPPLHLHESWIHFVQNKQVNCTADVLRNQFLQCDNNPKQKEEKMDWQNQNGIELNLLYTSELDDIMDQFRLEEIKKCCCQICRYCASGIKIRRLNRYSWIHVDYCEIGDTRSLSHTCSAQNIHETRFLEFSS